MGNRYVVSDVKKSIIDVDADSLFGWTVSQSLPYDEIEILKDQYFCMD